MLRDPYVTAGRGGKSTHYPTPFSYGLFLEGTVLHRQTYKILPLSSEMAVMSVFFLTNVNACLPELQPVTMHSYANNDAGF